MAKYTTELRTIYKVGGTGFELPALLEYPIWNEDYRQTLNNNFKRHFWYREIGFETPTLFNHYLLMTLNEIMPYYNQLFKSAEIEIADPLTNNDLWRKHDRKSWAKDESTTKTNSNSASKSKSVNSTPPNGLVDLNDIEQYLYATDATLADASSANDTESNGDAVNNATMDYLEHIAGTSNVSKAELLMKYRESFINPLRDFLRDRELNQCFMGVY